MNKNMKYLVGQKWSDISDSVKSELLQYANAIDGKTGNRCTSGECIVDLDAILSVSGFVKDGNILISDDAILYDPEIGI